MATRSRIGIQLADESILSVYHHWDGYPEWLGRILKTHYNSRAKAAELIDGGDMSTCWNDNNEPEYYSARGQDCPPYLDANKYEYLADGEEYSYIYTLNDEWICYNRHQYEENMMPTVAEIPSAALAC
jgi:hypothetical protein